MTNPKIRTALVGVALFFVQLTFVPLISLGDFVPDLVLLWLLTVGIRRGHIEAALFGFAAGFLQDLATTQFFGLAALSKCTAGFVAGYFFTENTAEQTLGSYRLLVITSLLSLFHNAVYYAIFYQGFDIPFVTTVLRTSLGMSLYTTVVALFPMFAYSRTYRTQWTQ